MPDSDICKGNLRTIYWRTEGAVREAEALIADGIPFCVVGLGSDADISNCLKFAAKRNCHCRFDPTLTRCLVNPFVKRVSVRIGSGAQVNTAV